MSDHMNNFVIRSFSIHVFSVNVATTVAAAAAAVAGVVVDVDVVFCFKISFIIFLSTDETNEPQEFKTNERNKNNAEKQTFKPINLRHTHIGRYTNVYCLFNRFPEDKREEKNRHRKTLSYVSERVVSVCLVFFFISFKIILIIFPFFFINFHLLCACDVAVGPLAG